MQEGVIRSRHKEIVHIVVVWSNTFINVIKRGLRIFGGLFIIPMR